ncbi:MAG TPA: heme-binding domain-containing protein [Candidatus Binataceae bacterium]|nr:heme-binding domain-containing protein [Candidatus Binataceae bacterium]
MRALYRALIGVSVLFLAAQLIPVPRDNPSPRGAPDAPAAVASILRRACYDCHSNQTRWPWYSAIAPVSWVVSRHVREARERLNFSQWADYASDPETAAQKLREIANLVQSGKMPPWYYRMMHQEARLDAGQSATLVRWARARAAAAEAAAQ